MKYLKSTNSVLNFFLVLLVITLCSFFFFAPSKYLQENKNNDIAKIELTNFNMYQVNNDFVDMKIEGSKAFQFSDREILYGFLASRYNTQSKNTYEYISGDEVIKKGDMYHFPRGAIYIKSDGGSFWSEGGVYNYRKEIFKGEGDFIFNTTEGYFEGEDIIYNKKTQMIKAKDISSKIILETKEGKQK
ncbi:hypothetical protein [Helicobacter cappadocius]|uniref:LPS export ABC transporter periplasmic protein LptC n=1 Tax=Helicobacter cappadocius TaxID=3063998 RepID=A0AA90PYW4_9HELI|nr:MULTISPECIES: hypothetical protein [unclassified Helicobacter]MDO7253179.1 hypothetical protein [Helicobacter sp. faydin-H75]MDP2539103.1 hypothetical protein [Helicobacter sp. faydin-H76]